MPYFLNEIKEVFNFFLLYILTVGKWCILEFWLVISFDNFSIYVCSCVNCEKNPETKLSNALNCDFQATSSSSSKEVFWWTLRSIFYCIPYEESRGIFKSVNLFFSTKSKNPPCWHATCRWPQVDIKPHNL